MSAQPWPVSIAPHGGTAVACGTVLWRAGGQTRVTVIVKAAFAIVPDGAMTPVAPRPLVEADVPHDDNPRRSLAAASEIAPYLARADVFVTGHAYAPPGKPQRTVDLRLAVLRDGVRLIDKALRVRGDRPDPAAAPAAFQRMPLVYERAPANAEWNPVGVAAGGRREPNLALPSGQEGSVGYGPIARWWPARHKLLGGVDARSVAGRTLDIPDGFDWSYLHTAPPDQRIDFPRGDELLVLGGLTPNITTARTHLPGVKGRAQIYGSSPLDGAGVPVALWADTIAIDTDEQVCSIVFRGNVEIDAERIPALHVLAGIELPAAPLTFPERAPEAPSASRQAGPAPQVDDDDDLDDELSTTLGVIQPVEAPKAIPFAAPAPAPPLASPPVVDDDDDLDDELSTTLGVIQPVEAPKALPFAAPAPAAAAPPAPVTMGPAQPAAAPPPAREAESTAIFSFHGGGPALPFRPAPPGQPAPLVRVVDEQLDDDDIVEDRFGGTLDLPGPIPREATLPFTRAPEAPPPSSPAYPPAQPVPMGGGPPYPPAQPVPMGGGPPYPPAQPVPMGGGPPYPPAQPAFVAPPSMAVAPSAAIETSVAVPPSAAIETSTPVAEAPPMERGAGGAPPPIPVRASEAIPVFGGAPLVLVTLPWQVRPPQDSLTVIVKGSFAIAPSGPAQMLPETDPPIGDKHLDDDPDKSVVYPSDLAIFKPKADVTLTGHAIAPGGSSPAASVRFKFGGKKGFSRQIAIFGERQWQKTIVTLAPTDPRPFQKIPLIYENAFGGPGFDRNPTGIGLDGGAGPDGLARLPHLEDPENLIKSPVDKPAPACFAPVAATWKERWSKLGTYDARWLKTRWPYFADDFDWAHFQSAPPSQQLDSLSGDEPFEITGMSKAHPALHGRLPGIRARCFFQRTAEAGGAFEEVVLRLDTAAFDVDAMKIHLVWRGVIEVSDEDAPEIAAFYVMSEALSEAPLPIAAARQRFFATLTPLEVVEESPEGEPEIANEPEPEEDLEIAEMEAAEAARRAEIEAKTGAVAPPDPGPPDPEKVAAALRRAGVAEPEIERMIAAIEEPDGPPPPREPDPALRDRVIALLTAGEPLDGLDLDGADLSDLDFEGRSLVRTSMRGANLRRAKLTRADLTEALLTSADLTEANLDGANLRAADLTETILGRAHFSGAHLHGADLSRAKGEGANFQRAGGEKTIFEGGTWTEARFDGAVLASADFTGAILDRAVFASAELPEIMLYDARGADVSFEEARLPDARADGVALPRAMFRKAHAPGSIWERAKLDDASFLGAKLEGASFVRASCLAADFSGADLREATLRRAKMAKARLLKADLMEANLERADLTGADLRGSNLHGAETRNAKLEGAKLDLAIVTQSKLEGRT